MTDNQRWLLVAAGIGLLVLLIVLAAGLRIRARRLRLQQSEPEKEQDGPALSGTHADRPDIADGSSLSLNADALITKQDGMPSTTADAAPPQPIPAATPVDTGPPLRLAFVTGRRRGDLVELSLRSPVRLGRAGDCALVLSGDDEISGHHAEIERLTNGQLVLRDLNSTNGTRLNGVGVQGTHPLQESDRIGLGQTELRVLP